MKVGKFFTMLSIFVMVSAAVFADEAYDVMKKFTTLDVPDFSQATLNLEIIEKNGKVEKRTMMQYGRKVNGLKATVFDFKSPANVKDTRVLQSEKSEKDDDRWIYLPELKTSRRIPTAERSKQFVGCEFTYNDMSIRHVDDDTHEMISPNESITINGSTNGANYGSATYNCWKIKSTPKKKSEVEYSFRYSWIDKNTYLPVKMEYYDKKDPNVLLKTFIIEKIDNVKGESGKNYVLRRSCFIENHKTGRKTRVMAANEVFDKKLSAGYFTQNWLQTGKAK